MHSRLFLFTHSEAAREDVLSPGFVPLKTPRSPGVLLLSSLWTFGHYLTKQVKLGMTSFTKATTTFILFQI